MSDSTDQSPVYVEPELPNYYMSIVNHPTTPAPSPEMELSPNSEKNTVVKSSSMPLCRFFLIIAVSFVIGSVVGGAISYLLATSGDRTPQPNREGTACNPAKSCEQIKEALDRESGWYYVQGESKTPEQVYCDMESFGGGWTRFGKDAMLSQWNFVEEDQQTTTINIISDSDLIKMQRLHFTEFKVFTDVEFRLQADDSINPSFISAVLLPDLLTPRQIRIVGSADHTHVLFDDDDDQLECFNGSVNGTNRCGSGGLPPLGKKSQRLFFQSAFFGPRATGAWAAESKWERNRYTWNGDYYFILAK